MKNGNKNNCNNINYMELKDVIQGQRAVPA